MASWWDTFPLVFPAVDKVQVALWWYIQGVYLWDMDVSSTGASVSWVLALQDSGGYYKGGDSDSRGVEDCRGSTDCGGCDMVGELWSWSLLL